MRKELLTRIIAILLLAGSLVTFAPLTSLASEPVNMDTACIVTLNESGARAWLKYPELGGFGWRCYIVGQSGILYDVDIQKYCDQIFGLDAAGGSTAYNWRCE